MIAKEKKAQGAIEMLVVAAILLIVVASALILIAQPNIVFNLQRISAVKYWEGTDVGIVASQQENSMLRLTLQNNILDDVRPTAVTIITDAREVSYVLPSHTLSPQKRVTYNISHPIDLADTGEQWAYFVTINYTNLNNGESYQFVGEHQLRGQLVS